MLTFVNSASSSDVYHLVALAAATIRWASHETGRSEAEIVAELAENYGS
jgi:endo-1,4-beta-D-glucanase Y